LSIRTIPQCRSSSESAVRDDGARRSCGEWIDERPDRDIALVIDSRVSEGMSRSPIGQTGCRRASTISSLFADSDMRVGRDYLDAVTAHCGEPAIGLVTLPLQGWPTGGLWSKLARCTSITVFCRARCCGRAMGTGGGCFGATIALRRAVLERIGGLAVVRDELADDHRIGTAVRQARLCHGAVALYGRDLGLEKSFRCLWQHELRWARTVRVDGTGGLVGSVVTHAWRSRCSPR